VSQDFDRASQAAIDSVIAPGRFHVFRTAIFDHFSKEYFEETLLGRRIRAGDDATLSRLGTRMGRVVYQSTCRAQTRVVTTMQEFLQQFTRWERNTLQHLFKGLMEYKVYRPVYWLSAVDVFLRLGFGGLLTVGVIHDPLVALKIFLSFYITFVLVLLKVKPAGSWLELSMTGVAPFLKALQLIVLWPLRLYALFTIRYDRWGTR
jgi:hyaluronan synthase